NPHTSQLLDVLKIDRNTGKLVVAWGWIYDAFDWFCCSDPGHTYEIDVSINSSIPPTAFTFVLPSWSGDFGTSEKPSVRQPSSTPNTDVSQLLPPLAAYPLNN